MTPDFLPRSCKWVLKNVIHLRIRVRTNLSSLLPGQEVAQRHELAMSFILDIDYPPMVFPPANRLATNDHVPLRSNHGEWNHVLGAN